jgi:hypothetical protein
MTEAEWLQSDNYMVMTYFVAERMSLRKLRLAEVAVCRRVEHHLIDERSRHALEVSEAYADGLTSNEVLTEARSQADVAYESLRPHHNTQWNAVRLAALSVRCATGTESDMRMQVDMIDIALGAPRPPSDSMPPEIRAANVANAELVRDVFGNPFRPLTFDAACRTSTVVALASQMYESRDFGAMPILGDALQDAGCDNEEILNHCRREGPHVRGCWVVDLILSKDR